MARWLSLVIVLRLGAACTSAPAPSDEPHQPGPDGGILLQVPDAGTSCGGAESGSGGAGSGEAGSPADCVPSALRDYQTEVRPVLASCQGEVCHGGAFLVTPQLMLLVGAPAAECCGRRELIVRGHPERSYMLDKVRGQNLCDGSRMPLGGPYLAPSQIQILSDWICEGAPF